MQPSAQNPFLSGYAGYDANNPMTLQQYLATGGILQAQNQLGTPGFDPSKPQQFIKPQVRREIGNTGQYEQTWSGFSQADKGSVQNSTSRSFENIVEGYLQSDWDRFMSLEGQIGTSETLWNDDNALKAPNKVKRGQRTNFEMKNIQGTNLWSEEITSTENFGVLEPMVDAPMQGERLAEYIQSLKARKEYVKKAQNMVTRDTLFFKGQ